MQNKANNIHVEELCQHINENMSMTTYQCVWCSQANQLLCATLTQKTLATSASTKIFVSDARKGRLFFSNWREFLASFLLFQQTIYCNVPKPSFARVFFFAVSTEIHIDECKTRPAIYIWKKYANTSMKTYQCVTLPTYQWHINQCSTMPTFTCWRATPLHSKPMLILHSAKCIVVPKLNEWQPMPKYTFPASIHRKTDVLRSRHELGRSKNQGFTRSRNSRIGLSSAFFQNDTENIGQLCINKNFFFWRAQGKSLF